MLDQEIKPEPETKRVTVEFPIGLYIDFSKSKCRKKCNSDSEAIRTLVKQVLVFESPSVNDNFQITDSEIKSQEKKDDGALASQPCS